MARGGVTGEGEDTLVIIGVGDIMPGTDYPSEFYLPPGRDCRPLLEEVIPVLNDADITFGNLEGTFAGNEGTPKPCRDTTQCFVFRMPDEYAGCIAEAGFDIMSIANNHASDFGDTGRIRTERILDAAGIAFAGSRTSPSTVVERDGVRYGLAAFAPFRGCYDIKDTTRAKAMIEALKNRCDILIVSVHGGAEGADHQHVTRESEMYLGYDRGNVYSFSHLAVDAGADIVFGHGPHVTRAMEIYRDRFIIYSLGNFCTYGRFNLRGPNGIAPIMKVYVGRDGRFLKGRVIPVMQTGRGGVKPDPEQSVIGRLRELNRADFPEIPLEIDDEGIVSLRRDQLPVRQASPDSGALPHPPDSAGASVPKVIIGTFLGNAGRHYYGNRAPGKLGIIWKHYLGEGETVISRNLGSRTWAGAGWTGQPLLVEEEGEVYLIQGAYDHHLKKIKASTGEVVWEYEFDDVVKGTGTIWRNPDPEDAEQSLVILQGSRLGVGNYLDTPHIPSYRAISYQTGRELWRLDVKWTDSYSRDVDGSALILRDTAYIGLENSLFTVLNPDPGKAEMKDGMLQPAIIQERKLYKPEDVTFHSYNVVTESSPSLLGDHIYIASGSGHVFGYSLKSREIDWDFYIGSDMDGSAIVTGDSCLIVSVEKQYIEGQGGAYKLDPSKSPDECVVWFCPVADSSFSGWEGGIIGSAGISDYYHPGEQANYAAFVGIDGYLRVVDHRKVDESKWVTGTDGITKYHPPWLQFETRVGPSISTPVFCGNKLIVAGYNGIRLYEFDGEGNFRLLDRAGAPFESTPVVHDGRVYIASRDGYLYCFGEPADSVDN